MPVGEFCRHVGQNLNGLVDDLQRLTGRTGENERLAWMWSLDRAARVLNHPTLADFHLHVGQRGSVSVEYRLPASASWCDLVVLGRNPIQPAAVVVELKDWDTYGDQPGPSETLVWHHGELVLHPSDQVRGYVEYCRRFHSAVHDQRADVAGCVYFTQPRSAGPYLEKPHDGLVADYPIFTDSVLDVDERFPEFLRSRLTLPDQEFAEAFEVGVYQQDRSFTRQVAQQIADPSRSPFVLLDHQRHGLELCKLRIQEALARERSGDEKTVIVIEGPPGSGKSAIAAQLWAELAQDERLSGDSFVVTTTSSSQRRNWESFFERAGRRGARGFVMPANRYAPADARWVGQYSRRPGAGTMRPETWRENTATCLAEETRRRHGTGPPFVSIVDEAHALINPEQPNARPARAGWPLAFGPQAYHIIRSSRVSVFLMDVDQGFRDRECTTRQDIEIWATELGATVGPPISLAGAQFRLAGSVEYVAWIENVLGLTDSPPPPVSSWRRTATISGGSLLFEVVPDPLALEDALRPHVKAGDTARLLATFGRPWKSKPPTSRGSRRARSLAGPTPFDFDITFEREGRLRRWEKIWNAVPGEDYTLFVQALPGTAMEKDPLAEIGCPYTIRGFDYDWVGVLWLKDLVWRKDRWTVDLDHVHESGVKDTQRDARREALKGTIGPAHQELLKRVKQAYRILLTRAMKGLYIWVQDPETAVHLRGVLSTAV